MKFAPGKTALRAGAVAVLAVAVVAGFGWYRESQRQRETDNAYVNADIGQISAQVTGQVARVRVRENDFVKAGDVLFELDARPFEVALEKAEARLALARQTARQDSADIVAAEAEVARARASLDNANSQLKRSEELVAQKFLSQQALDDARAKARTEAAGVAAAEAKLARARAVRGGDTASPEVLQTQADIAQAKLDLEHTRIVAPSSGRITNFTLVAGSNVTANTPVAALIVDGSFWVDANFKETQLAGLAPGQKAEVVVDMYPNHVFHGTLQSLSGGTGTAFSLLPPQNATGNWVKVTQRVPVRVHIDDADAAHPLRVGATASVTIALK
ncbi:MAG: HlyD family secretion protein [Chthoniobacteraceae bacterium]